MSCGMKAPRFKSPSSRQRYAHTTQDSLLLLEQHQLRFRSQVGFRSIHRNFVARSGDNILRPEAECEIAVRIGAQRLIVYLLPDAE